MVKRTVVLLMCLMLVATLAFGTGKSEEPTAAPAQAARIGQGRTLVVGIWGGPQETLVREHVVKQFEAETGATVELVLGGSSDRFARLIAEKDNPTMDVFYLSLPQVIVAKRDGLIKPLNPAGVPEYKNLYPQAVEAGAYGVAFLSVGIMVNTEFVKEMPTSWTDLWKPEYKGKVAPFVFPGSQGEAFLVMAARAFGGGEKNINPGFEAISKLKPFPAILSGVDETNLAFKQGDIWLAPQIHGLVNTYQAEGGKVKFVVPKEGAPLALNSAAVSVNSKNADLAEIFINLHLSQACQEAYAKELYYAPTNKTVVLSKELAEAMPYGQEQVSKLLILDNDTLNEQRSAWADRWNREILR